MQPIIILCNLMALKPTNAVGNTVMQALEHIVLILVLKAVMLSV